MFQGHHSLGLTRISNTGPGIQSEFKPSLSIYLMYNLETVNVNSLVSVYIKGIHILPLPGSPKMLGIPMLVLLPILSLLNYKSMFMVYYQSWFQSR